MTELDDIREELANGQLDATDQIFDWASPLCGLRMGQTDVIWCLRHEVNQYNEGKAEWKTLR